MMLRYFQPISNQRFLTVYSVITVCPASPTAALTHTPLLHYFIITLGKVITLITLRKRCGTCTWCGCVIIRFRAEREVNFPYISPVLLLLEKLRSAVSSPFKNHSSCGNVTSTQLLLFWYHQSFTRLSLREHIKTTCLLFFLSWDTRIRTWTNRTKICCATITPYPNLITSK